MKDIIEILNKLDEEEKEIDKEIKCCEFVQEHSLIEEEVIDASIALIKLDSEKKTYKHIKNLLKEIKQ